AGAGGAPRDMAGGEDITAVAMSLGSGCPQEKHTDAWPGIASVIMLHAGQRTSTGAPPAGAKGWPPPPCGWGGAGAGMTGLGGAGMGGGTISTWGVAAYGLAGICSC